jgi:integrase
MPPQRGLFLGWQRAQGATLPRLTEKALAAPPRKPRELLVHPSGLRARGGLRDGWSFFFRVPGSEEGRWVTYTLGRYGVGVGELMLPQALERMREKLRQLEEAPEAENTVEKVAEGFLLSKAVRDERGRVVKRGGRTVLTRRGEKLEALLRVHALNVALPGRGRFGALAVANVEAADLKWLIERARETRTVRKRDIGGPRPAQSLLALLKLVLGYAVKMGQLRANPFADWKPADFGLPPSQKRRRALDVLAREEEDATETVTLLTHPAVDLPGLLSGAPYSGTLNLQTRAALVLLLHTALRTNALLGTRRADVDLGSAILTVQPHLQKGDAVFKASADPWACPLSPTAVAVCRILDTALGQGREWLLPMMTDASRPLYKAAAVHALRDLQRSGLLVLPGGHLVGHDLRRSWSSAAERLGVDAVVIEKQQQHQVGRAQGLSVVAVTYMRDPLLKRRREAVELVDAFWRKHWAPSAVAVGEKA